MRTWTSAFCFAVLLHASSAMAQQFRPQLSEGMEAGGVVVFFSATTEGAVAVSAVDAKRRVARVYVAPDSVGPWLDSAAAAVTRLMQTALPIAFDSTGPVLTGSVVPGELRLERRQFSTEREIRVIARDRDGTELRVPMQQQEFLIFAKGLRSAAARTRDLAAGRVRPDDKPDPVTLVEAPKSESDSRSYFEFEVEKPAMPRGGCAPTYPEALRQLGRQGTVIAQFVVSADGRADPRTFRVIQSPDPLFGDAVREALQCMRFKPAEIGGRKVRQLVQQPFEFGLTR
ncbi:MAG TPA: energy transducer TonB [Gemmatimonadaceae bacterium]|nr:energy transducer TonB [Gemmatimonadaceae bacterium]